MQQPKQNARVCPGSFPCFWEQPIIRYKKKKMSSCLKTHPTMYHTYTSRRCYTCLYPDVFTGIEKHRGIPRAGVCSLTPVLGADPFGEDRLHSVHARHDDRPKVKCVDYQPAFHVLYILDSCRTKDSLSLSLSSAFVYELSSACSFAPVSVDL